MWISGFVIQMGDLIVTIMDVGCPNLLNIISHTHATHTHTKKKKKEDFPD